MSSAAPDEEAGYSVEEARRDLAAAHRLAVRDDLNEGTWNHLSLTVPGEPDKVLLTPRMQHWSLITASELAVVGPDEDTERMKRENDHLWVGYRIHYPIHMARPDAKCVLHAHTPYATALTMVEGGRLEWAEQNALEFHGQVAYTDEFDAGMELGAGQGAAMAEALGDATVLFLRNHGVVVVGESVAVAYTNLYLLERACRVLSIAIGLGKPLALVPDYRRDHQDERFKAQHFAAMRELLDRTEPDYVN